MNIVQAFLFYLYSRNLSVHTCALLNHGVTQILWILSSFHF